MAKSARPKKDKKPDEEVLSSEVTETNKPQEDIAIEEVSEGLKEEKPVEPPEPVKYIFSAPVQPDLNLSMEERIDKFLTERSKGNFIKMNDFLKSLYKIARFNEPPEWSTKTSAKQLRILLDKMQSEGKLTISNNRHLKLGSQYYTPDEQRTTFYTLNTVVIEAKK